MRHGSLIEKYQKAEYHFEKGNYKRAEALFRQIVFELEASDTDSMADIDLHNSAESYLDEIMERKHTEVKNRPRVVPIIVIVLLLMIVLYIIYN